jgi:hypothetical protein
VVTKSSREASIINCFPRLVTSGKSAEASNKYFNALPYLRVQASLSILDLFCC